MNNEKTFIRAALCGIATLSLGFTLSTPAVAKVSCNLGQVPQCVQQNPTISVAMPSKPEDNRSTLTGISIFATDSSGNPVSGSTVSLDLSNGSFDEKNIYTTSNYPKVAGIPNTVSVFTGYYLGYQLYSNNLASFIIGIPQVSSSYGLNLFFEGDQQNPDISVVAAKNSPNFTINAKNTLSLSGQSIQSPGTSSFFNNQVSLYSIANFNILGVPTPQQLAQSQLSLLQYLENQNPFVPPQIIQQAINVSTANQYVTLTNFVTLDLTDPNTFVKLGLTDPTSISNFKSQFQGDNAIALFTLSTNPQDVVTATAVPESSTGVGTLALGALGLGGTIARKVRGSLSK